MSTVDLPSKPGAPLAYQLIKSNKNHDAPLVVFINGLGIPSMSWNGVISFLQESASSVEPHLLTYDRFGQGATKSRDPTDELPGKEPGYGHDLNDAVNDLHELLQVLSLDQSLLVFVAASIGAHIARLYADKYPKTVSGLLILDSNIGNMDFTDLWPNPHSADFNPEDVVGTDCTLDQYIEAYTSLGSRFNSDVKNPEGLDRRNVKTLLPSASSPKLQGPDGKGPWLIVAGHDPEQFGKESFETMKTPFSLTKKFTQP